TGSPALLGTVTLDPGTRQVVVGTAATSNQNLYVLNPDGSQAWTALLAPDVVGDVAVGQDGNVYASTDASCGATPNCTALNVVVPPQGGQTSGTVSACQTNNSNFGAPPALANISGTNVAYAVALARSGSGTNNLLVFSYG